MVIWQEIMACYWDYGYVIVCSLIWLSYHFATTSYIIRYDMSFTDTLSWQAGSIGVLTCFISYYENLDTSYPLFSITNRVLKAINDMAFSCICIYTCKGMEFI